uniref:Uncharacterized protein n=1 Tax=Desertifilum tharense IPPAS B-1220 TaxID=1781255 RepID=A0ACD5GVT8_9CYAN
MGRWGKKGVGNWELGVGGKRNSGLTPIAPKLLGSRDSLDSALFSYSEHRYAEASYGTLHSFPPPSSLLST